MNLSLARMPKVNLSRSLVLGVIILSALAAFEMFNYSTTDFALSDLLGDLTFLKMRWSTILAVAFCGIDFAGIGRLFTSEQGVEEPKEVWYLFGAWFLAATMNAMLTWWGVSMAIVSHSVKSTVVVDPNTLVKIVPIFIALMVWVIRILIIGTISLAGNRMFTPEKKMNSGTERRTSPVVNPYPTPGRYPANTPVTARPVIQRSPISASSPNREGQNRAEPSYQKEIQ